MTPEVLETTRATTYRKGNAEVTVALGDDGSQLFLLRLYPGPREDWALSAEDRQAVHDVLESVFAGVDKMAALDAGTEKKR